MLVAENRPRNLSWLHAGPLLFGDWGTSRLYVLGLAFYYTAHASAVYLAAMSILMTGVAWAYTVICRNFQEGGGVYTVGRQLSPTLAVFGATLLLCDYVVTAALSIVDGIHYFGIPAPAPGESRLLILGLCVGAIFVIGIINWFGARSAGRFALVVAVASLAMSAIIGVLCLPFVKVGLSHISWGHSSVSTVTERWQSLVRIVLALSGVEAVANMTGLMKPPVPRTAKRTIWPVLIEVVVLNLIFGIALTGLPRLVDVHTPDYVTHEVIGKVSTDDVPADVKEYRDTAVKMLATAVGERAGGPRLGSILGIATGIVFGLLLLSAVNTAIMAVVSVLYSMSRDSELPRPLSKLNYSGVPWVGLIIGCAIPVALLVIMSDVAQLANLYAVGVCGAVTISVLGCVVNRKLELKTWERAGMTVVGAVMFAITLTIVITKHEAALFAGSLIAVVLITRAILRWRIRTRERMLLEPLPEPESGWLAELRHSPAKFEGAASRIMLAVRGQEQAEFAVDLARRRKAALFAIFVRTLRVIDVAPGKLPRLDDDTEAQQSLGTAAVLAKQAGVAFFPIYVTSPEVADEILDYTVTYGCDTLIMGKSRRGLFSRSLAGDVVGKVARNLPDGVSLVTRSARWTPEEFATPPKRDEDDEPPPS